MVTKKVFSAEMYKSDSRIVIVDQILRCCDCKEIFPAFVGKHGFVNVHCVGCNNWRNMSADWNIESYQTVLRKVWEDGVKEIDEKKSLGLNKGGGKTTIYDFFAGGGNLNELVENSEATNEENHMAGQRNDDRDKDGQKIAEDMMESGKKPLSSKDNLNDSGDFNDWLKKLGWERSVNKIGKSVFIEIEVESKSGGEEFKGESDEDVGENLFGGSVGLKKKRKNDELESQAKAKKRVKTNTKPNAISKSSGRMEEEE